MLLSAAVPPFRRQAPCGRAWIGDCPSCLDLCFLCRDKDDCGAALPGKYQMDVCCCPLGLHGGPCVRHALSLSPWHSRACDPGGWALPAGTACQASPAIKVCGAWRIGRGHTQAKPGSGKAQDWRHGSGHLAQHSGQLPLLLCGGEGASPYMPRRGPAQAHAPLCLLGGGGALAPVGMGHESEVESRHLCLGTSRHACLPAV